MGRYNYFYRRGSPVHPKGAWKVINMDDVVEVQRSRWRRVRAGFRMDDPESEDFSTSGLALRVAEPSVRLLILPPDPESLFLDFTPEMWAWWLAERANPASGRTGRWSRSERPTSCAMVSHGGLGRQWQSYLALHRNGGLEIELGRDGAVTAPDGKRYFRLTYIVGQVWAMLALHHELSERIGQSGPWEVTAAVRNTEGAFLCNFAKGWVEPGQGFISDVQTCSEPSLLLRRELREWPDADATRDIAFSFGGWLEDRCKR
jgi:hypothetical protein